MKLKKYYKQIGALLLFGVFLLPGEVRGQGNMRTSDLGRGDINSIGGYDNQPVSSNPFEDPYAEETEQPDSAKQKKPRKPLESWFFGDSIRAQNNFAWNVDMSANRVYMTSIDTLLQNSQIDFPFQKLDVGDAYQGNLGGGSIPLAYYRRPNYQDFSFTQPFYSYIYTPDNAPFYNVKKPYTRIGYLNSGQKMYAEENFSVVHAQNASPSLGFNITYHTMQTKGMYMNQRTKNTDFSAGISYTGKRYSAHGGYIFNTIDARDNGGVVDDWHIYNNEDYEKKRTEPVWLTSDGSNLYGARAVMKNNTFYTIHTYGVPLRRLTEDDFSISDVPAFYVGYSFQYDRWNRKYTDLRQYTGTRYTEKPYYDPADSTVFMAHFPQHEYYKDWFATADHTRDSLAETKLSNKIFIQLQPWDRDGIIGTVDAGVGADIHGYYMFRPDDYLTGISGMEKKTSYYVYGSVDGKFRKYFDWNGKVRFVPAGYRQGDLDVEANALLSIYFGDNPVSVSARLQYRMNEPSYWTENWFSNHFKWSNSFDKENETRLEAKLAIPSFNMDVEFYTSVYGNKVYYSPLDESGAVDYKGQSIRPVQAKDVVSVTGLYAHKDFRLGGFRLNNRALLQWSTDQNVVPVPLLSLYLSWGFEFNIVKNVLRARVGIDARWNTPYTVYGYNPAVGQFYNQKGVKYGGYPWMDAFAVLKWKRARIFLKFTHVNEDLFDRRDYFMIAHYPLNRRAFKFGVSWSWYD